MASYDWAMSVSTAEALRRELAQLRKEEAELKRQGQAASERAEKAASTRQRKATEARMAAIREALADAPPPPMAETEAVDELLAALGRLEEAYLSSQQKFVAEAGKNPAEAIRWQAEGLLVAQEKAGLVAQALAAKSREVADRPWGLADVAAVIEGVERQAERNAQHFDPLSLSTSAFSNVVAACRYRAAQGLLGDGYDSVQYLRHRAERLEQHVAAHQRLREEMQAEALAASGENGGDPE